MEQDLFGWFGDAMQDAVFFDRNEQKCSYHGGLNNDANLPENMPGGPKELVQRGGGSDHWWETHYPSYNYFWPLRSYKYPFSESPLII